MIKISLDDNFSDLSDFIKRIPDDFNSTGDCVYDGRNVLKVFNVKGLRLCVKSFKKPNNINKIVYKYFRESKAYRSYEHAQRLINLDINTPKPIACIEESGLFLERSYYVSFYDEYDMSLRDLLDEGLPNKEEIFREFLRFTYCLHSNGVLHLDYSPGNILISKNKDKYSFSLVDLNRMIFKPVDLKCALKNLSKIWASSYMYPIIADEYSKYYNASYEYVYNTYFEMENKHKIRVERKKRIKRKFKSLFK